MAGLVPAIHAFSEGHPMSSVNKATLIGHLGADPTVRTMNNGDKAVSFSLATGEKWTDKRTGERREKTEWHNIVIWNQGIAGVAEQYLRKGSKVYLEGQLQTRKWQDRDGKDRYTTEIVLQAYRGELVLLDGASGSGSARAQAAEGDSATRTRDSQTETANTHLDDDIPF
jgi:single-strand DNA-binding protein